VQKLAAKENVLSTYEEEATQPKYSFAKVLSITNTATITIHVA
jgi:hypothetical protein